MNLLVFGNPEQAVDNLPFTVIKKICIPEIKYSFVQPNDDLHVSREESLFILDTVVGIDKVTLLTEKDLDKLVLPPKTTAHDYDLGFQLKYLKKIGRLKKVFIVGLPMNGKVDYDLLHSILRKLVAQDIQGS
jgi:hypothetical protein